MMTGEALCEMKFAGAVRAESAADGSSRETYLAFGKVRCRSAVFPACLGPETSKAGKISAIFLSAGAIFLSIHMPISCAPAANLPITSDAFCNYLEANMYYPGFCV